MLEFVLVGIPMVFMLISISEMARGMWLYQTLAFATNETMRYAAVHGKDCGGSNTCSITVETLAQMAAQYAIGLSPSSLNVTFTSASGSVVCNPLSSCYNITSLWPPSTDNALGSNISMSSSYQFHSALSMFWPGAAKVSFGVFNLGAYSGQRILF